MYIIYHDSVVSTYPRHPRNSDCRSESFRTFMLNKLHPAYFLHVDEACIQVGRYGVLYVRSVQYFSAFFTPRKSDSWAFSSTERTVRT